MSEEAGAAPALTAWFIIAPSFRFGAPHGFSRRCRAARHYTSTQLQKLQYSADGIALGLRLICLIDNGSICTYYLLTKRATRKTTASHGVIGRIGSQKTPPIAATGGISGK